MAKNKGGQRARRLARQAKRARAEAQLAAAPKTQDAGKGKGKAVQAQPKAQATKPQKAEKPGVVGRARNYLHEVKTELRRVVWPNRHELWNYSVAVIALLIAFGLVVWLVDTGIVAVLVGYSGFRG